MADPILDTSISSIQDSNRTPVADSDRKKLADDFDQFLLLLTTQLKNQDPTEPLDTNDFTAQLVQFASVEQQIASNQNLESLVALAGRSGIDAGVGYIGKAVDAAGNTGILAGGVGQFAYDLPQIASEAKVVITDSSGQIVFEGDGSTLAGKNVVNWDGVNSKTGEQMPDGNYNIAVTAKDAAGGSLEATTYTTGRVSAVELDADGSTNLVIGNIRVPSKDILSVRETI